MNSIRNKSGRHFIGIGLAVGILGCGGAPKVDDGADQAVAGQKLVIIPDDVARGSMRVEGASVSLPAAQYGTLKVGSILVSGWQAGLLRSVESVSRDGDRVIALTQPALIGDAIERGRLQATIRPSTCASTAGPERCGLTGSTLFSGLDLSNTPISESSELAATIREGTVVFDPNLDIAIELAEGRVKNLELRATGDLRALIDVDVSSTAPLNRTFSRTVWTSPGLNFVQRVGNVPVVETITVSVDIGVVIDASTPFSGRSRVEANGPTTVGARFQDGAWTPIRTDDLSVTGGGEVLATGAGFTVRAFVRPRIDVKFFAIAGPYVTLEAFGLHSGSLDPAPVWTLNGGLAGGFGSRVAEAFDLYGARSGAALRSQGTVFTLERPLSSGTFSPSDPGPVASCSPFLTNPIQDEVMDNGRTDSCEPLSWQFDWSDCPAATAYHLYVIREGSSVPTIDRANITASSYDSTNADGNVAPGELTGWTWKVRAQAGGTWGPWSDTRRFDVEPIDTDRPLPSCGNAPDAGASQPDAGEAPRLCSRTDGPSTEINFVNECAHRVTTFWMNGQCQEVEYATIPIANSFRQQTYAGHPWRIRHADTRALILDVQPVGSATPATINICR